MIRSWAFDLKIFCTVVAKDPREVAAADVFEFLADQRGDRTVVRLADRESGLSARTIARRLSSVSGLYAYAMARGDTGVARNPVTLTVSGHLASLLSSARPVQVGGDVNSNTARA